MRYAPGPHSRVVLSVLLSLVVGACAYAIPEASPADIPALEQSLSANPTDTDVRVRLGMAQFKGEMYEASRMNLQAAVDSGNVSGPALLYLGMVQEEFEEWSDARDAYSRYLDVGRSEALKEELRKRLQLIGQNVLRQRSLQALATEAQIGNAQATPRSVAVFPFAFNSSRTELQPLIYALSDMMVTDFAVSNALVVLERAQIQSLLNEMAMTEGGYALPGTGARAGRMLQAEHVVQGVLTTLGGDNLQVDADILNVPSTSSAGTVTASDELANLFDLEKDLVFRTINDVLNVQLTPAEEQRIRDNRTDNVLAFLAYGRGLRERDNGNYAAAQAEFQQAQQLDPSFDAAASQVTETTEITQAATSTTADIGTIATTTGETGSGGGIAPPTATTTGATTADAGTNQTLQGASEAVNPTPTAGTIDLGSTQQSENQTAQQSSETRDDAVQESQGSEGATTAAQAQIRIVIRRPGGGQ